LNNSVEVESKKRNENPFSNGPKLHLYKRNRRIQTSGAARAGSVTGQSDSKQEENPYLINSSQDEIN